MNYLVYAKVTDNEGENPDVLIFGLMPTRQMADSIVDIVSRKWQGAVAVEESKFKTFEPEVLKLDVNKDIVFSVFHNKNLLPDLPDKKDLSPEEIKNLVDYFFKHGNSKEEILKNLSK